MWGGHSCPPHLTLSEFGFERQVKGDGQECPSHTMRLLNQSPSVGRLFFGRDDYRCGDPVPGFDVQQADALG